jgi:AAA family ATP:ADP antiporter
MSADKKHSDGGILGRFLTRVAPIEPHEVTAVVAGFCLFFCVLGGYFAVRPVRETVGTLIGRDRVADLYVATWIASIAIIPIYGALVARFRRSVFLPWIYGSVALALAAVGVVFATNETSVAMGQFFYVFISVLNLFVVSVFWSFLLELFHHSQSKRLFGVIAAGGTAGALVGPFITDLTVDSIGNSGVLFLGAGLFVAAILFQRVLLRIWRAHVDGSAPMQGGLAAAPAAAAPRGGDKALGGNPFAGFWLVLKSPYLLGIATFVILLASVSTLLYFEQLRLVEETFADSADRTRVFARIDWIVQGLTIVAQIFITGRVASKLGLTVLLMIVPVAMIGGFLALAASSVFMTLAIVIVLRRFGEYAFVRPGREMLWSRLDTETKYKAKSLIDVPVYRGADALVAQATKGIENSGAYGVATIGVIGAVVAAVWAINGWWLGRRHDRADAKDVADAASAAAAASRRA